MAKKLAIFRVNGVGRRAMKKLSKAAKKRLGKKYRVLVLANGVECEIVPLKSKSAAA